MNPDFRIEDDKTISIKHLYILSVLPKPIINKISYHIFKTLFACICDKLFPSACRDDNRKSCILNGERLSCPARNVVHLMTSDVNKWRDVTPNLRHSSVLLTFF